MFPRKPNPLRHKYYEIQHSLMLYCTSYIFRNQGLSGESEMKASTNKQTKTKRTKLLSSDPDSRTHTTNLRSKSYQAVANKTQYNDMNNHGAYKTPWARRSPSVSTVFQCIEGFLTVIFLLSFCHVNCHKTFNLDTGREERTELFIWIPKIHDQSYFKDM